MITTFIISLKILKYGVEIMRGHKFLRIYEWVLPVSQVTGTSGRGGFNKSHERVTEGGGYGGGKQG